MLLRDRFVRGMLVVIAGLLAAHFFFGQPGAPSTHAQAAQAPQDVRFDGGTNNGAAVALACSSDGKIVYVADDENIYRSLDFGKPGSWEHALK